MKKPWAIFLSLLLVFPNIMFGQAAGTLPAGGNAAIFNVKNFGAKGDSQATSTNGCSYVSASPVVNCAGASFKQSDVGKTVFGNSSNAGASAFGSTLTTILSVQSATQFTASTNATFTATGDAIWGTLDDTAIQAAVTAAKAQSFGVSQAGNLGVFTSAPQVYFPAGGYLICSLLQNGMVNLPSTTDGFVIRGDAPDQTFVYSGGSTACPLTNGGGAFAQIQSGASNIHIQDMTFDGGNNFANTNAYALNILGFTHLRDLIVQRWGSGNDAVRLQGSSLNIERVVAVSNQGIGIHCFSCSGEMRGGGSSNNTNSANLVIELVNGSNSSQGFHVFGMLVDECGSNAVGCTQVRNSNDVTFHSSSLFGTIGGPCLNVDANSLVRWEGGLCGSFGTDTNVSGPVIQAGGVLQESNVRNISIGTAKCLTATGTFNDNGGNTCESMFTIASGTSTGTAAVLTVNTLGANANTNCTVGDSLMVQAANIAGYNGYYSGGLNPTSGITAVTATTISYTTQGSNLGALGAGGTAYCRNLQNYSGTTPRTLLTNGANTFVMGIAFATGVNFGNQALTQAVAVTRIKAISQAAGTTTCATAPVFTLTDGTTNVTLTLTSGKNSWDSTVDSSTGIGSFFKNGATLTGSFTAGACATPPVNPSITYNWQAVFSN